MSISPLGTEGVPRDPNETPLSEAVDKLHSALYRAGDCLRRAGDGIDFGDVVNVNTAYADRQLMLTGQAVEEARIAVEIIRREISNAQAAAVRSSENAANRGRPMFPSEGPYEGGA